MTCVIKKYQNFYKKNKNNIFATYTSYYKCDGRHPTLLPNILYIILVFGKEISNLTHIYF